MSHNSRVLADSISPDGVRLTTFEVVMPRIVLAEFNTHRMFSRNSASSSAIPVKKMIASVLENPYVPASWGKNQKGMQAGEDLDPELQGFAGNEWLRARDAAVHHAKRLLEIGLHKQLTNRLLEPFMWHTVIVTATEWDNFWHLRCHEHAHPDIRKVAQMMRVQYETRQPVELDYGEWHLPLVGEKYGDTLDDGDWMKWVKISCGRCARVSYLTHDGIRDIGKDIELHDGLLGNGHMSPFEHAARPMTEQDNSPATRRFSGNFRGWVQYRKTIPGEADKMAPSDEGGS